MVVFLRGFEVPCPLLGRCKKKVDFDHYQKFCSATLEENWRKCEEFVRLTSGQKTPAEWSRAVSPFAALPAPTGESRARPSGGSTGSRR